MTTKEAIFLRKSRRTFDGNPLSIEEVSTIQNLIEKYNLDSGLQMKLVNGQKKALGSFLQSYGMLSHVSNYIAMIGPKNLKHLEEKVGYFGEKLILEATTIGLGTCFVGGSFGKKKVRQLIEKNEHLCLVIAIGKYPEKAPFKERTIYNFVHRKQKAIEDFYESNITLSKEYLEGMNAVQAAPSAMNRQGILFHFEENLIYASIKIKGVFDHVDLGIAKANFEIQMEKGIWEFGNEGKYCI